MLFLSGGPKRYKINKASVTSPCILGSELSERLRERDSGTSSSSPLSSSSSLSRRRAGFLWAVDDASGAVLECCSVVP